MVTDYEVREDYSSYLIKPRPIRCDPTDSPGSSGLAHRPVRTSTGWWSHTSSGRCPAYTLCEGLDSPPHNLVNRDEHNSGSREYISESESYSPIGSQMTCATSRDLEFLNSV